MNLSDKTKDELIDIAVDNGIELPEGARVDTIRNLIKEKLGIKDDGEPPAAKPKPEKPKAEKPKPVAKPPKPPVDEEEEEDPPAVDHDAAFAPPLSGRKIKIKLNRPADDTKPAEFFGLNGTPYLIKYDTEVDIPEELLGVIDDTKKVVYVKVGESMVAEEGQAYTYQIIRR